MKKLLLALAFISIFNLTKAQWQHTNGNFYYVFAVAANGTSVFAGSDWGTYRSTDKGDNWTQMDFMNGLGFHTQTNCLGVNGANIYAGTAGYGVYSSSDNGVTWSNATSSIYGAPYVYAIGFNSTNIFLGINGNTYLSADNCLSWASINSGLYGYTVNSFSFIGTNIFASGFNGVYKSVNNGGNWTYVINGMGAASVPALAVMGTTLFAATLGNGIYISTNDGGNWTAVNTGLTNLNATCFAINGTTIFAGTYGGVFYSTNNGSSWIAFNDSLTFSDVRSLAISDSNIFAGTYGNGVWRRRLPGMETLAALSTASVTNITQTTAIAGGNISNDGGATVTTRGICWSTTQNPTISNSHSIDGAGYGTFTSSITGLMANTTYYVRAYATNSIGTAYGNEINFTTQIYTSISKVNENNNNLIVLPNPANNLLQIQTTLNLKTVEIIDITGRLMITTLQKTIDCSNLANGVYFIRLETEKGIVVKKFIKE